MKVACVGNMNNNFFSLVRFLRDKGVDAHLFLREDESNVSDPANDAFIDDYKDYTTELTWGKKRNLLVTPSSIITEDLNGYDFIIACGTTLAYLERAGIRVDIFSPHGSDLKMFPFIDFRIFSIHFFRSLFNLPFIYYQRKAIKNTTFINTDCSHPMHTPYLHRLKVIEKAYYLRLPMVYTGIYESEKIKQYYNQSETYTEFKKIRDEFDIVIFHNSRHVWKKMRDAVSLKGNDILIKGMAKFISDNPSVKICMVTFEYGDDVAASKSLIKKLNIETNVKWFPQMPRKEIMMGLSLSDIGTGHFQMGFVGGGTIMECLAMGKPLLHWRNDDEYGKEALFPMVNVQSCDDISQTLQDFLANPEKFNEIGIAGKSWYDQILTRKCVNGFISLIQIRENGKSILDQIKKWKNDDLLTNPSGINGSN